LMGFAKGSMLARTSNRTKNVFFILGAENAAR